MKIIAVVPARSGSKGVKNKNIHKINGKTLLELAIEVAKKNKRINDIYVSTDSAKYEKIALKAGAKSLGLRPEHLSGDQARITDVLINLLDGLQESYDYLLLLQPTSPQRTSREINQIIKIATQTNADAVVSVSKFEEPHPYKLKVISETGIVSSFVRGTKSETPRQMLPKVYRLTGAYYLIKIKTLLKEKTLLPKKTTAFITEPIVNIDTKEDLDYLKYIWRHK